MRTKGKRAGSRTASRSGASADARRLVWRLKENGVTNGMLQTFLACEQRARFSMETLTREGTTSALEYGNMWHQYLDDCGGKRPRADYDQEWSTWWRDEQLRKRVNPFWIEEHLSCLAAMSEHYWRMDARTLERVKWVATEQEFAVPVGDVYGGLVSNFSLRGKIDGVFRQRNGKLWLFETKTKSQISRESLESALEFDPQNLFYITAAEVIYEEPVVGVMYNVIRNPGTRFDPADAAGHCERLEKDCRKKPEHYFLRLEAVYSQRQKDEFQAQLLRKLQMLCAWVEAGSEPLRRECSCIGRWNCQYLRACATGSTVGYIKTGRVYPELATPDTP